MKKFFLLLLALVVILSACGKKEKRGEAASPKAPATESQFDALEEPILSSNATTPESDNNWENNITEEAPSATTRMETEATPSPPNA